MTGLQKLGISGKKKMDERSKYSLAIEQISIDLERKYQVCKESWEKQVVYSQNIGFIDGLRHYGFISIKDANELRRRNVLLFNDYIAR